MTRSGSSGCGGIGPRSLRTKDALKRYPFQGTRPFPTAFHEDGSVASI